jgi:exodeoxyribonuclease V beta subunit
MIDAQKLDIMTMPLQGRCLIEASAGTGKTYTLTNLVLRILLGHKTNACTLEQILVVTFTNAATDELKDRIRQKIQMAYRRFLGVEIEDPIIEAIFQATAPQAHQQALQRLDLALRTLDEASIYTIHSFCHQMLQELAFETGQLFEFQYELDDTELLQSVVRDTWRKLCYGLAPHVAQIITQLFKTPDALLKELRSRINQPMLLAPTQKPWQDLDLATLEHAFEQACQAMLTRHERLKLTWNQHQASELEQLLKLPLHGTTYGKKTDGHPKLHKHWHAIDLWLNQGLTPQMTDKQWRSLCYDGLKLTKGGQAPAPENLSVLVAIQAYLDGNDVQEIQVAWLQLAKKEIETRLSQKKQQHNCLSSDDLLSQLAKALTQHPQKAQLAEKIRALYPIALIDEFQDTDPIQYQIFYQIYRDSSANTGWFMIGDPKQAIYAFRGADIFTYIHAKKDLQAQKQHAYQFHLDTNYRACPAVIDGVNQLFGQNPAPFKIQDTIEFMPVLAPEHATNIEFQAPKQAGLEFRVLTPPTDRKLSSALGKQWLANDCANEIASLLNAAKQGQALLEGRPIQPKDITLLVRSRQQAELMQQALRARRLHSVFLSRDDVFATQVAKDLRFILQAMAYPRQENHIRCALATSLLNLPLMQVQAFNQSETLRLYWLEKFFGYHQTWQHQTWLSAFTELMIDRQVPTQCLQTPEGTRKLTDIRHLAELIQKESQKLTTPQALLHWFDEKLAPETTPEHQQLRLESEHDLIQIVTIHKSKGLEYNLCWIPFLSLVPSKRQQDKTVDFHQDQNHIWDCYGTEAAREAALLESAAEDIRLLYVAMTRAKYLCSVPILHVTTQTKTKGTQSSLGQSALGYLLCCTPETTHESLLATLKQCSPQITCIDYDAKAPVVCTQQTKPTTQTLALNPLNLKLSAPWRLSSYSGLLQHHEASHTPSPNAAFQSSEFADDIRMYFPKGAHTGNFLHQLLESIDFSQDSLWPEVVEQSLAKFHFDASFHPATCAWLHLMMHSPLSAHQGQAFTLSQLSPAQKWVEMEFYMPVQELHATTVNQLLQKYGYQSAPSLSFDTLQGMLKGFIDLWFEWQGRYYVADYKSNHLGTQSADYEPPCLEVAIAAHRYDLQYLIYSVALHRFLKRRVPDYRYETHFGGCYYLFLRGMGFTPTSGIYFDRPDPKLIEGLEACFTPGVCA